VLFSTLSILGILNGFNLIDGTNGLAGGIGVIVLTTYGYWLYRMDDQFFLILCMTLIGSLLAFLRFNFRDASIFMGDSGSLVLGYLIAIISIRCIQISRTSEPNYFLVSLGLFMLLIY